MAVPMLDLRAQYRTMKAEIDAVVAEAFEAQAFVGGPNVTGLEDEVARYLGAPHALGVASGTDALLLSLRAAGVGPGDEVIVPDYSFFASTGVISRLGATPVFVDIEEDTYNIDPSKIEEKITDKTKAIMPVHLFGQVADMYPIVEIADSTT